MRPTSSRVGGFFPDQENIQLAQDYSQHGYMEMIDRNNTNKQVQQVSKVYQHQNHSNNRSNPASVLQVRHENDQPLTHRRSMPGQHKQEDDYLPLVMLNPPIAEFDEEDR